MPKLGKTTATHSHHGFQIQSVLVPKDKFSKEEAIKYIKQHFEYNKIHETPSYFRFRQIAPTKNSKYFTKVLADGVELVFEKPPIGPNGIKPREVFGQVFKGSKDNEVDRRPVKSEGGSLKVNEIYQVIKNGYEWPDLKPLKGYKYLKDLSNTFHQVYKNEKQKRIIVNYTGTKGIIDWLNNLDYILQTYTLFPRFQNAKAVLDKVLKRFPNYKITLVSHSQGGIITRELSKLYGDELFEIIALNPGNMSVIEGVKTFFGDDKKRIKENEYTIKSEADFASFFAKKNKNDIIITNETGDIIKEHKTDILFRLNPDLEIGRK